MGTASATLLTAPMFGLRVMYMNARLDSFEWRFDARFEGINQRFDDMRDLWRAELHRVEEALDARLKHIEQERR